MLGSLFSFASLVVLFQACVEPRWAFDAVNSVDMGLWHLAVSKRHTHGQLYV
jgi:hypothetical protein